MANSKYEYVRLFEQQDVLLPNTWIVVRIDGRGFHKLSAKYQFEKPNDRRALDLMNAAAVAVMQDLPDLILGYGVSDEYSFVFHRSCQLFERRASKLVTTIVSCFTANYIHLWSTFFPPENPLTPPHLPTFDGRAVQYPSVQNLRDYLSWRQVDCHINNLYNTTFWNMVQLGGMDTTAAELELKGTVSSDKNEILFSRFGLNYNNELDIYRKGSVVFREYELEPINSPTINSPSIADDAAKISASASVEPKENQQPEAQQSTPSKTQAEKIRKMRAKAKVVFRHIDIIKDEFWERRPWLLSGKPGRLPKFE